jgi:hypothetical protein
VGRTESLRNAGHFGDSLQTRAGTLVGGFHETESAMTRQSKEFVHEGKYAAEVPVELIEDDTAWSPYLTPQDVHKLDTVRLALRRGDIAEASKYARVFELIPVAAE